MSESFVHSPLSKDSLLVLFYIIIFVSGLIVAAAFLVMLVLWLGGGHW